MNRWFGLRCRLRLCPAVRGGDAAAVWTECTACGRRWDVITRAEIAAGLLAMRDDAEAAEAEEAGAAEAFAGDADR